MSIAKRPSEVTLPPQNQGWVTILDFLDHKFPRIGRKVWQSRIIDGKVHWQSGEPVTLESEFKPSKRLCYYREVQEEPRIPFEHKIIFKNDHLLVVCKPHFLPVTPGSEYVNECLLERVRRQTGITDIVPLHRLDRDTAGLVMFSINPDSRHLYYELFSQRKIKKTYLAVAHLNNELRMLSEGHKWNIENRLKQSKENFTMVEVEGEINSSSEIELISKKEDLGFFELTPESGKKHQLRMHMMRIGAPILNDRFYPKLLPKEAPDFENPLQLLAQKLFFNDPINQIERSFETTLKLSAFTPN